LIDSGVVPVVRLQEVFRQAKESFIVENAHRMNRGEMPREPKGAAAEDLRDYYFIEENDAERCADILIELCRERIRERFGLDPINDVQVISPMQRGSLGVQSLNARLQEALNPPSEAPFVEIGDRIFRQGDKVIQIRNNYEKNVFNGDIGIIRNIEPSTGTVTVGYDSGRVEYTKGSLDEIVHAYAITVHKSQGSEYPAVVIPLHTQHYPMLQRNLVYTALTRAKRLAVFIGSKKALGMAIKNAKVRRRWSHLSERVRDYSGMPPLPGKNDPEPPEKNTSMPPAEEKETSSSWDERPPDHVYEYKEEDADDSPPLDGELTYHPVNE
jgi:exodeoxyribonuclease V alpha subunit